ncbi:MAG: glutathione S-transferase N-terminal domain-containing protein [Verrucomicrobiota bacterium]
METALSKERKTLADYPITDKWKPKHPELIQVYTYGTPNGVKIPIALEEMDLPYEVHHIPLNDEGVKSPDFLSLNPNNKIPAIIDPNVDPEGVDGDAIGIFESGAILTYLANKTGQLCGIGQAGRSQILQWLFFQVGGIGPMLGQFGYFHVFDGKDIEDPRPRERFLNEAKRLLNVLNVQLENNEWLAGDYSIADIATGPWLECIERFYKAGDVLELNSFSHVADYIDRFKTRPAVIKGWEVASVT